MKRTVKTKKRRTARHLKKNSRTTPEERIVGPRLIQIARDFKRLVERRPINQESLKQMRSAINEIGQIASFSVPAYYLLSETEKLRRLDRTRSLMAEEGNTRQQIEEVLATAKRRPRGRPFERRHLAALAQYLSYSGLNWREITQKVCPCDKPHDETCQKRIRRDVVRLRTYLKKSKPKL